MQIYFKKKSWGEAAYVPLDPHGYATASLGYQKKFNNIFIFLIICVNFCSVIIINLHMAHALKISKTFALSNEKFIFYSTALDGIS